MTSRQQKQNHSVAIDIYEHERARELVKSALKTDETLGAGPASGAMKTLTAPQPPKPPEPPKTPTISAPLAPKPPKPPAGPTPTTWQNMTANAGRTSTGILGAVGGGLATAGTGAIAGATNAWNASTPKSWNAPKGWTQGANDVFDKAVNFTNQSAKDIYGGLGGDTNYHTSLSNNAMEAGLNAPGVDPTTRAVSQTARDVGQNSWNIAQTAAGGNIAAGALKMAPGAQAAAQAYSKAPAWMQKGLTYTTGMPFSRNVNQFALQGSMLGQGVAGGFTSAIDANNAAQGNATNYSAMVPMIGANQLMERALGPDLAGVTNNAMMSRVLGPSKATAGLLVGVPGAVSALNNFSNTDQPAQAPAPALAPAPAPDLAQAQALVGTEQPAATPYADTATYADPTARTRLYSSDGKPNPAVAPTQEQHAAVQQSVSAAASPSATPEQKQTAQQDFQGFMQQQADSKPEFKAGAADLVAGKNTPQAQQFRKHLESVGNDVMDSELKRLYAENPNPTPEQAGSFMSQATNAWNNLGTPGQIMVGLGGGLALVSMIMSMFGGGDDEGGGLGGMLLPMLGLGAAGLAGAGSGMFGSGAQNAVVDTLGSMGQSMGFMPKSLSPEQKSILTAKDPIQAALAGAGGNLTREQAAKRVAEAKTQLGNLKLMRSLGGTLGAGQNRLFENMGLTPEEAALAVKNVGVLGDAYSDPKSQLNQKLQEAQWYADPNKSGWKGWAAEKLGPQNVQNVMNFFTGKQGNAHMNIAEQIYLQNEMMKAARCWAGYEPVPGKAPYSEDSCRPKGGKKKDAKKEKKAAEECCDGASVPEHTATEKTKQIKPKPAVVTNDKKVITGALDAAIKKAIAGEGKGEEKYEPKGKKSRLGQSVFTHVEKKDKEELDGAKPSHEGSKHIKVTREEPEESEDLRAEEVFPDNRPYVD